MPPPPSSSSSKGALTSRVGGVALGHPSAITLMSLHVPRNYLLLTISQHLPFCGLYLVALYLRLRKDVPHFVPLVAMFLSVTMHVLLQLLQQWFMDFKCTVRYNAASKVALGVVVHARPRKNAGKPELCPLQADDEDDVAEDGDGLYFVFQKRKYIYSARTNTFDRVRCPKKEPLSHYTKSQGMATRGALSKAKRAHGRNVLSVPVPKFLDLYQQQLMSPLCVFQLFCASLWLFDAYWKYTCFSIFMILVMEGSTVFGRIKNLNTLRNIGGTGSAQRVWAYRFQRWAQIDVTDVVPGDIVTVDMPEGETETSIPFDAVLLGGAAVVNEASLTGESVPQMKEALSVGASNAEERLDMKGKDKVHVLFSGTSLVKVETAEEAADGVEGEKTSADTTTSPSKDGDAKNGGALIATTMPDGTKIPGCRCYVLRTGFASSQGKLMRMIEFSQQQVRGDTKETLLLLLILLCFALCGAGYVLHNGLKQGKKSVQELLLRCLMIMTSVVPPELPMQTALAVNTALMALLKANIFCTEPFRLPFAGKVNICLFDKTGTLTTDQLQATGAAVPSKKGDGSLAIASMKDAPTAFQLALCGCQSLVEVHGDLVGDPIETAALRGCGWRYVPADRRGFPAPKKTDAERAAEKAEKEKAIKEGRKIERKIDRTVPKDAAATFQVLHRFHFSSSLQRMAVLAKVQFKGQAPEHWALVKGSPEAVGTLLKSKLTLYDSVHRGLAARGQRVLAIAHRRLTDEEAKLASSPRAGELLDRAVIESNLEFDGFASFACLLRNDSGAVVEELRNADNLVAMATGDAPLTALVVASDVGMIRCCRKSTVALQKQQLVHASAEKGKDNGKGKGKEKENEKAEASALSISMAAAPPLALHDSLLLVSKEGVPTTDPKCLVWRPALSLAGLEVHDGAEDMPYDPAAIPKLVKEGYNLCVTGEVYKLSCELYGPDANKHLSLVSTFARMPPDGKSDVVKALREVCGLTTLMCGDGGNDVGALKSSHVGLALLCGFGTANAQDPSVTEKLRSGNADLQADGAGAGEGAGAVQEDAWTKAKRIARENQEKQAKQREEMRKKQAEFKEKQARYLKEEIEERKARGEVGFMATMSATKAVLGRLQAEARSQQGDAMRKHGGSGFAASAALLAQAGMSEEELEAEGSMGLPMVKLGDASVAAPFTSKKPSVQSTVDIVRQGRCTLVSTMQMQQILVLNCMISAYSLSVLYLDGIKASENQLMATGMMLTTASFAFSFATPLDALSSVRPLSSVFHPALFLSILAQMVIHLGCMLLVVSMAKSLMSENEVADSMYTDEELIRIQRGEDPFDLLDNVTAAANATVAAVVRNVTSPADSDLDDYDNGGFDEASNDVFSDGTVNLNVTGSGLPNITLSDTNSTGLMGGLVNDPFKPDPRHKPNLLNTCVFLIETAQQVSVYICNYKGRPFMKGPLENSALLYSLAVCGTLAFTCAFEVSPALNKWLGLVSLPSDEFRWTLLGCLAVSVFGSLTVDRMLVWYFAPHIFKAQMQATLDNANMLVMMHIKRIIFGIAAFLLAAQFGVVGLFGAYMLFKRYMANPGMPMPMGGGGGASRQQAAPAAPTPSSSSA